MTTRNKSLFSLILWITALVGIGGLIGALTKPEIIDWYSTLKRAPLTPPNYIFPIVWTLFYAMIGICGWLVWQQSSSAQTRTIKILYVMHLILNWSWSPLFFYYRSSGGALIVLCAMNILVARIISLTYHNLRPAALLMIPYCIWLVFAGYLNFYIWWHN